MMVETVKGPNKAAVRIVEAQVVRKCPYCGRKLYEKLGKCDGMIQIKCQRCGKSVNMNLALRKARD